MFLEKSLRQSPAVACDDQVASIYLVPSHFSFVYFQLLYVSVHCVLKETRENSGLYALLTWLSISPLPPKSLQSHSLHQNRDTLQPASRPPVHPGGGRAAGRALGLQAGRGAEVPRRRRGQVGGGAGGDGEDGAGAQVQGRRQEGGQEVQAIRARRGRRKRSWHGDCQEHRKGSSSSSSTAATQEEEATARNSPVNNNSSDNSSHEQHQHFGAQAPELP